MARVFPRQFADIEEIAGSWAAESHETGHRCAADRSMDEMRAFYRAVSPRAAEILHYCKPFDATRPPREVRALLNVMYSLIVVSTYMEDAEGMTR